MTGLQAAIAIVVPFALIVWRVAWFTRSIPNDAGDEIRDDLQVARTLEAVTLLLVWFAWSATVLLALLLFTWFRP